jgi:hypothetical protein
VTLLLACVGAAAAIVIVLTASGGGPSESLAAAAPPRTGAPPASWVFTRTPSGAWPIAITTDPRGRAYVMAAYEHLDSTTWVLLRERADGLLHTAVREGPLVPHRDIETSNVAVGADGTPIVAWMDLDNLYADVGGHESVVARHVAPGLGRTDDADPALIATRDGGAAIAWTSERPVKFSAWIAARRPGQTAFGRPRLLGTAFERPTLLAEPRGGVTVVWNADGGVRAMTRSRGGNFAAPVEIARDVASSVSAAIGSGGRIVVAWSGSDGIRVAERPAGQTAFGKPVTLFGDRGASLYPEVGVDRRGLATIAWQYQSPDTPAGEDWETAVAKWPADSRPGTPRRLARINGQLQYGPRVLVAPAGSAVVVRSGIGVADNAHPDGVVTSAGQPLVLAGAAGAPVFSGGATGLVGAWQGGTDEPSHIDLGRLHQ